MDVYCRGFEGGTLGKYLVYHLDKGKQAKEHDGGIRSAGKPKEQEIGKEKLRQAEGQEKRTGVQGDETQGKEIGGEGKGKSV